MKQLVKATKEFPCPELFLLDRNKEYEVVEEDKDYKGDLRWLIMDDMSGMVLQFPREFFELVK
jgi:hypothetical protein